MIAVVHQLVAAMASEAATANDEASSKPPTTTTTTTLVCAPCWICLEDGPDDDGEPLVRNCACRGETSAGYHVSCIIDYARVKTNEAIDLREKEHKVVEATDEPWKLCPNCKQPYDAEIITPQLAEAWLEHTKHLPESHYVRFRARCLHLDTLTLFKEDSQSIEIEAKAILQTLEESPSELAGSFLGGTSARDQYRYIEAVVAGESVKPLAALGSVKQEMDDLESALVLYENALEHLDVAEAAGYRNDGPPQRKFVEGCLRDVKREMGLISPSEEVAERREDLKQLIQKNEDKMIIANAKYELAFALKEMDPPQYFEAVKLLKESSDVITQLLGPEHGLATMVKSSHDTTKKEYRQYLQDVAKKGKEQT